MLKNPDLNRLILNHGSAQKLNQIKSEGEGLTKKILLSGREVTSIERTVSQRNNHLLQLYLYQKT